MAYRKATATCVWGHNSLILARMQLQPRKGTSLIVVQLFGVRIIHVHHILVELCVMEKKEEKRKKEEQNRNFCIQFSQL